MIGGGAQSRRGDDHNIDDTFSTTTQWGDAGMSWTDERIQELTRLWQEGHSASEIGKRLGVSKNSVVGKAHRLKLPSRPSPIKQTEEDDAAAPARDSARKSSADQTGAKSATNAGRDETGGPDETGSGETGGGETGGGESGGEGETGGGNTTKPATRTANTAKKTKRAKNGKTANGAEATRPGNIRAQVEARGGGNTGCLWPIGDPGDPEFHFCGANTIAGKPYCAAHAARAYITRSRGEREEPRDDPQRDGQQRDSQPRDEEAV